MKHCRALSLLKDELGRMDRVPALDGINDGEAMNDIAKAGEQDYAKAH